MAIKQNPEAVWNRLEICSTDLNPKGGRWEFGRGDHGRYVRRRRYFRDCFMYDRGDNFGVILAGEAPMELWDALPDPKMGRIFWNMMKQDLFKEIPYNTSKLLDQERLWIEESYGPIDLSKPVSNYSVPAYTHPWRRMKRWIREVRYQFLLQAIGEKDYSGAMEKVGKDGRKEGVRLTEILDELYRYHLEQMSGDPWEEYLPKIDRRALSYAEKWIVCHGKLGKGWIDPETPFVFVYTEKGSGNELRSALIQDIRDIPEEDRGESLFEIEKRRMILETSGKMDGFSRHAPNRGRHGQGRKM